jgi:hypothetical protein
MDITTMSIEEAEGALKKGTPEGDETLQRHRRGTNDNA